MHTGNAAGDIAYSDDNGITWSTIAAVCPYGGAGVVDVACDGYGSFIIHRSNSYLGYVSVDDGLTWTEVWDRTGTATPTNIIGMGLDTSKNVDDTPTYPDCAIKAGYDTVTGALEVWHTLAD
jgi:hypothetical protein